MTSTGPATQPPAPGTPLEPGTDTAALVDRLFAAVLGTLDVQTAYLGDRLGYYRALADGGPQTSAELAARCGTAERYTREWLEQQAVTGFLTAADSPSDPGNPRQRRFALPDAAVEPFTDQLSPNHLLPLARFLVGVGKHVDALAEAHRTGGGVSWADLGDDVRQAQAAANRPLFLGALGRDHLPSLPEVDRVLRAGGRVADVGCGEGWSAIGIALAYPAATVDGYDVDLPSVEAARRNAAEAGVGERVRFEVADAATVGRDGTYDLVTAFECIHDLPRPVDVLAAMRRLAGEDGHVLVMDERVAETFGAPGDDVERLMYGYSVMCCLADGLSSRPSVGTGTVMRPAVLRGYAREAGFTDVEVLPIADDFFRFYRLVG
ncbi:class I SAM-dependent methyltransferase [Blastococcus sp. MG754426]|uniref:class I SAM-dependent methyltransferase n=1 Tax=unclassified Blastococcus TaxID=2619396 RepID=UPI001EEFA261|nr:MULTISPECIES: class I SAM-dependent methyltransferase [unclassified Blastococcus]MCF6506492.1 class I SAM-dependent methyltransferase [Blastococcus sp. MG754426]MCF6511224.1 class I SAM-dependent methyltransferase [Blastococcus sp. MG754427]